MSKTRNLDVLEKQIGCLFVKKFSHMDEKTKRCIFECVCKCGNILYKSGNELRRKITDSCLLCPQENPSKKIIGSLEILYEKIDKRDNKRKGRIWIARCKCGKETEITTTQIKFEFKKTCGCRINLLENVKDYTGLETNKFIILKKQKTKAKNQCYEYIALCKFCNKEFITNSQKISTNRGCNNCGICPKREKRKNGYEVLYKSYQYSAKKRKLEFNLKIEEFIETVTKNCYYCGMEPSLRDNERKILSIYTNGIDRLNNTKGYLKDNCVPCCPTCNLMKLNLTEEVFIEKCQRITNYRSKI